MSDNYVPKSKSNGLCRNRINTYFGSLFVAVAGVFQTGVNYDSAVEEDQGGETSVRLGLDTDKDGLSDREKKHCTALISIMLTQMATVCLITGKCRMA